MLARDLSVRASSAMILSISAVNGAFLVVGLAMVVGLANDLLSPSNTDRTNGSAVGDGSPAMEWAQAIPFTAFSVATLEALVCPWCCR